MSLPAALRSESLAASKLGALRSVTLPGGTVVEYQIDGIGRRVGRKVNGNLERRWIYRDTVRPLAELDAAGDVVARYVYADGVGAEDSAWRVQTGLVSLSRGIGR